MKDFDSIEEYKAHKMQKHEEMLQKQRVPYSIKVEMSKSRNGKAYERRVGTISIASA